MVLEDAIPPETFSSLTLILVLRRNPALHIPIFFFFFVVRHPPWSSKSHDSCLINQKGPMSLCSGRGPEQNLALGCRSICACLWCLLSWAAGDQLGFQAVHPNSGHLCPTRSEKAGCTVTSAWNDMEFCSLGLAEGLGPGTVETATSVHDPAISADLYPGQVNPTNPFQKKRIAFVRR